jgi:hypothetical protein
MESLCFRSGRDDLWEDITEYIPYDTDDDEERVRYGDGVMSIVNGGLSENHWMASVPVRGDTQDQGWTGFRFRAWTALQPKLYGTGFRD